MRWVGFGSRPLGEAQGEQATNRVYGGAAIYSRDAAGAAVAKGKGEPGGGGNYPPQSGSTNNTTAPIPTPTTTVAARVTVATPRRRAEAVMVTTVAHQATAVVAAKARGLAVVRTQAPEPRLLRRRAATGPGMVGINQAACSN
jgi:hypothetical protein